MVPEGRPVSLFLIGLFIGGIHLSAGRERQREPVRGPPPAQCQSIVETSVYLDETKGVDRNMAIIFAASERSPERKPRP